MSKKGKAVLKQRKHRVSSESIAIALEDLQATQRLSALVSAYLPWSGFSIRPSGLEKVLNEILFNRCGCVVECGGGLSTVYIAALLRQQQHGHLFTIEHNLEWLELLRGWLQSQELQDYVTLIPAPLTECSLALEQSEWYDTQVIQAAFDRHAEANGNTPVMIDLLLVDGPPAYEPSKELSRYPAAPFFQPFFADPVVVVLDDFQRSGEQEILARWETLLGFRFDGFDLDGGLAIGRPYLSFSNTSRVL